MIPIAVVAGFVVYALLAGVMYGIMIRWGEFRDDPDAAGPAAVVWPLALTVFVVVGIGWVGSRIALIGMRVTRRRKR